MISDRVKSACKHLPGGFVGMVLLLVIIERWVAKHSLDFGTPTAADWRQSAGSATKRAPKAEVLLFGDSMVKFGVLPRVLESGLKRSAYSLALYNGTPQTSYFLLKRAIDSGASPRAIVVDFQPELLMADHIRLHVRQWPEVLRPRDVVELARESGEPDFALATLAAEVFPTVKDRAEIRLAITESLGGRPASPRPYLITYARNWRENRGAQVLPRNPGYAGEVPPTYALFFDQWAAKPLNAAFVRKFLKLAESREIPVFWVLPPNVPPVQARRLAIGLTPRYDAFAHSAVEKYRNLTVLDAREIGFGHEKFIDAVHLDRQGAAELSASVAEAIARRLGGSETRRWLALRPSARSREIPLEDTEQSRLALLRAGAFR